MVRRLSFAERLLVMCKVVVYFCSSVAAMAKEVVAQVYQEFLRPVLLLLSDQL